jgi:transposase
MSKARLVITAVTVEKRQVSEVAKAYGVARSWIYTLLARYEAEGEAAFEPRSRRPKTSPSATSPGTIGLIVRLRKELAGQGLDAGPQTIAWHLQHYHQLKVSPATVSRCLSRNGLVTPDPSKRPKSSYIRFEADMPNECWQSDFTHYPLASGADTEILTWLDDHSRYALSLTAHHRVTGPSVLLAFRAACEQHGIPASTLTDIQAWSSPPACPAAGADATAWSTSCAASASSRRTASRTTPSDPGQGRTLPADHEELAPRPTAPARHPHRAPVTARHLRRRLQHPPPAPVAPRPATPATAYAARPKASPGDRTADTHDRIRTDRIDNTGLVTLRHNGRLHHIGIGRRHAGTRVLLLV